MSSSPLVLDREILRSILAPGGPLHRSIKGFEVRKQQASMLGDVLEAYNRNQICLVEAGTGTGKSMAYLLPALLWAATNKQRTVISTNTINLQEQLLSKDIPMLCRALNLNLKAVLVKGMGNYLCLRKLDEAMEEHSVMTREEQGELESIADWSRKTTDGTRARLPMVTSSTTWMKVNADGDTCTGKSCSYYEQCFLMKARQQAKDAQILVVNHHLLFADLVQRAEGGNYQKQAVLPPYSRIVLDEAHNVEDIATDWLADSTSLLDIQQQLNQLLMEKRVMPSGRLAQLKIKLLEHFDVERQETAAQIERSLAIDLPTQRINLQHQLTRIFEELEIFLRNFTPIALGKKEEKKELKLRIRQKHLDHTQWKEVIAEGAKEAVNSLKGFAGDLHGMLSNLRDLEHDAFLEKVEGNCMEITAIANRLEKHAGVIEHFVLKQEDPQEVRWMEYQNRRGTQNVTLSCAHLNVAKALANILHTKFHTVALCSATLTTNRSFQFVKNRLGITSELTEGKWIHEASYDSPFDYPNQALLGLPTDAPDPQSSQSAEKLSDQIYQALESSWGNGFVLFTSYGMMRLVRGLLKDRLARGRFPLFCQGDRDRKTLLEQFRNTDRAVLFGTDSFWEGVDVAGDALRLVILTKLPFKVPSEPIIEARTEAITAQGGNPFMDYIVPMAIVKFKQGFGRLIRHKKDRGCILCLDPRILSKSYGKLFLNSLPSCKKVAAPLDVVCKEMRKFYARTQAQLLQS